jgi:RNA polymerase sigma-70 factor, ECF subfamily
MRSGDAGRRRARSARAAGTAPSGKLTEVKLSAGIRQMTERDRGGGAGRGADPEAARLVTLAVAQVREGDSTGLHFLYLRYREQVRGCISRIVPDHHDAEDLTQSVFLKLMFVIDAYQPRGTPFGAWLMRVARNAAIDFVRARRALPKEGLQLTDEGRDQAAAERLDSLKRALAGLPRDQREVIVLRFVAGLPAWEIAELLQKTNSSVEGLQHRGRRAVMAALEELDARPMTA